MKKVNKKARQKQIALVDKREKHRLSRKKQYHRKNLVVGFPDRQAFAAPTNFCIYTEGAVNDTLEFIRHFAEHATDGSLVLLDFRDTLRITVASAVAMAAEIQSLKQLTAIGSIVRILPPRAAHARITLERLGVLSITGQKEDPDDIPNHISLRSGIQMDDTYIDEMLTDVEKRVFGNQLDLAQGLTLYGAITEALLNVINHAYPDPDASPEYNRWWLHAARLDQEIYIVVFDKGVGIPVTFPPKLREGVLEMLGVRHEGDIIKTAMQLGRTGTGQPGRGGGLGDVKKFIELNDGGKLWIFSNRGFYQYQQTDDESGTREHRRSIRGTLIQWKVTLDEEARVSHE